MPYVRHIALTYADDSEYLMKCPTCKEGMRCLDTRWNDTKNLKVRRWRCECGHRGVSHEMWVDVPIRKPKPKKEINVDTAANRLMTAFYGTPPKAKKEKDVSVKHTPIRSVFEDTDEDYRFQDDGGLGIDIPKGDDW